MVVKGSDSRKRVSLVRGNVAQSIVDQGRGVCVLSAEVQEAGRLGLRSAARQPSVGEVFRFEDVSNANGRRGCPPWLVRPYSIKLQNAHLVSSTSALELPPGAPFA